ncbi:MAG TPA: hypothetical protein VMS64_35605 [Candidatus Methylomirabilis sp.]|nr:hypothetical protein [Candidatus Methylomirabilis sp.]
MRIETLTADTPVHIATSDENIELRIGDARAGERGVATLSLPQAEMLMHALGLRIGQIRERQRRAVEQRSHLSEVLLDTEFRLHEH